MKTRISLTILLLHFFIFSAYVQTQDPASPTPTPTFNPDGYTVHVNSVDLDGNPIPVIVKYSGDLNGSGETPFDIYSDKGYLITMESSVYDIRDGYTGGYYVWYWENFSLYGSNSDIWSEPVVGLGFTQATVSEATRILKFADYNAPVIFPTPVPTPVVSTPTPGPPHRFEIIDAITQELVPASGFSFCIVDYSTFETKQEWTVNPLSVPSSYFTGQILLVYIKAGGYHERIFDFSVFPSGTTSHQVELFPLAESTAAPENTPVPSLTPTPSPAPELNPEWYYMIDNLPPRITFSHGNTSKAVIHYKFHHTSVRIIDWGIPERNGNIFFINPELIEWDGPAPFWQTEFHHTYDLGELKPGESYELVLSEWDREIETYTFTVQEEEPQSYEPPWQVYTNPTLEYNCLSDGNETNMLVTAMLCNRFNIDHKVISWGDVLQNGNVFTATPFIIRNNEAEAENALTYHSFNYRLGSLAPGDYTFRIMIENVQAGSTQFRVDADPTPSPTVESLVTPTPPAGVLISTYVSHDVVSYPENEFLITIKNYGAPCVAESHPLFTDNTLAITPSQLNIGTGESASFTAEIDWSQFYGSEFFTSYNAFIVTAGSEREYIPWQVDLVNSGQPSPTPSPVAKGDVDLNGAIDIVDALLTAQYYVGLPVTINTDAADVNCDGSPDIVDALLIAQFYVGLISEFC